MFGEYIRRAGTPSYGPNRPVMLDESGAGRTLSYLLILAIEELLDFVNRAAMRDERVHEIVRQISKIHVLEEARHVSFAKTFLAEVFPALEADQRATVIAAAPELVAEVVSLNLDGAVFEHLGIEDGGAIAKANPHHRATVVAGLSKLTSVLTELGMIDANEPRWRELGLIA